MVAPVRCGVEWYLVPLPPSHLPAVHVASDASGSWGCGAWYASHWFQLQWNQASHHWSIMVKELLPVVLACSVCGPLWDNRRVVCHCDNQAVVACLRTRTSKESHCMHMLRTLVFIEARTHSTSTQHTYTQTLITWQMIFLGIISPLSCQRCHSSTAESCLFLFHCWDSSWTRHLTGPHRSGSSSSTISGWPCPFHETDLQLSIENLHIPDRRHIGLDCVCREP